MRRNRRHELVGRRSGVFLLTLSVVSAAVIAPAAATATPASAAVPSAPASSAAAPTTTPPTWTAQSLPWSVPGPLNAIVNDVVCLSKSSCIAVGATQADAFIATLAKGHWALSVLAPPSGDTLAYLTSLSCPTKTACTAVGSAADGGDIVPLVATLASGTWTATNLPSPGAGDGVAKLLSVSCRSVSSCVAVGDADPDAFIETLSAGTWTSIAVAPPTGQSVATLSGVSCPNTAFCLAVGFAYHEDPDGHILSTGFAAELSAGSWSYGVIDPSGGTDGGSDLNAVTCPTASSCIIVGNSEGDALVELWHHGLWTATTGIDPTSDGASLTSVSCVSLSHCLAFGNYSDAPTAESSDIPFTETLAHGTWTPTEQSALPFVRFAGSSCVSVHSCVAVGATSAIATMTASGWTATYLAGPPDASLTSISCPSASTCTAVGTYYDSADTGRVAVESLADGTWTSTTVDLAVPYFSSPAVSCVGTTCVIVSGSAVASESSGGPWTVTPLPPDPGGDIVDMAAISCTAATACVAVGDPLGLGSGLIVATLTATGWTLGDLPVPPTTTGGNLSGVSCQSSTSCVAVGTTDAPGAEGLVETLSGTTWTPTVLAPPAGASYGVLDAVSCASATACVAVGSAGDGEGIAMVATLAAGSWTTTDGFDGGVSSVLGAVSCATSTSCAALGPNETTTAWNTLALTLSGGTWATTPVVLPSGADSGLLSAASCGSSCQSVGADQQVWAGLAGQESIFPMVATES
jgi:hypothetical protein